MTRSTTQIADQPVFAADSHVVDRPLFSALLVSTLLHVALVILLSLIVFGSGTSGVHSALVMIAPASEHLLAETPSFEISPEPSPPSDEVPELNIDTLQSLVIQSPPRIEPVTASRQVSSPPLAATTSIPVSKVVLSIQKRVSEAGGKKGEVQFALAWKNPNDVDLHVISPSRERISHRHKHSNCGGMLDVDMNVRGESNEPVENIRWITDAPWGRYSVIVNLFRIHSSRQANNRIYRSSEFQLLAQLGSESILKKNTVSSANQIEVYRFQYVPASLPSQQREDLLNELAHLQEKEEAAARPLLERALEVRSQTMRDRLLNNIIMQFPHTDTAIEAMQLLGGSITKR